MYAALWRSLGGPKPRYVISTTSPARSALASLKGGL